MAVISYPSFFIDLKNRVKKKIAFENIVDNLNKALLFISLTWRGNDLNENRNRLVEISVSSIHTISKIFSKQTLNRIAEFKFKKFHAC